MSSVEASVEIEAPLAEVWGLYFDPERWPAWVDGLEAVDSMEAGYPDAGGTLAWHSNAAGRGRVRERVVAHEPRGLHRIAFEDPQAIGELETTFEMLPARREGEGRGRQAQEAPGAGGAGRAHAGVVEADTGAKEELAGAGGDAAGRRRTRVTQRLSYSLRSGGPLRVLTDRLFIRGQMRGSLARSLSELRRAAERGARGGEG